MWIIIAGPFRAGARSNQDRAANLRALNQAAYEIFRKGHTPIIGVNAALPVIDAAGHEHYEEIMMPISLALAERCDAILRMGGVSAGADQEVEVVRRRGGKVFSDLAQIGQADA